MRTFTEATRYEYPLTPDSVVVDVGAHHGSFTREISRRYSCRVIAFEPIPEFAQIASQDQSDKVVVYPVGLSNTYSMATFCIAGDSTGAFSVSDRRVPVLLIPGLFLMNLPKIDLLKLNCEGGEYDLLDLILEQGLLDRIDNIQVQFHQVMPDCVARRNRIQEGLSKTHELDYCVDFVWEGWKRR